MDKQLPRKNDLFCFQNRFPKKRAVVDTAKRIESNPLI